MTTELHDQLTKALDAAYQRGAADANAEAAGRRETLATWFDRQEKHRWHYLNGDVARIIREQPTDGIGSQPLPTSQAQTGQQPATPFEQRVTKALDTLKLHGVWRVPAELNDPNQVIIDLLAEVERLRGVVAAAHAKADEDVEEMATQRDDLAARLDHMAGDFVHTRELLEAQRDEALVALEAAAAALSWRPVDAHDAAKAVIAKLASEVKR